MANNSSSNPSGDMTIKYGICLKNHATKFGDYSVDGCREFVKKGDDGTKEEFICANCGCFRSFHRMNSQSLYRPPVLRSRFFHPHVIPHGGGNAPIIFHPFTTRVMPMQYIRRPIFYYYP
uniref:ZF-HD homeobox protein n=1 Tax=Solanum tuberosum TaxID=4113 RepID=M1DCM9_SOLTU